MAISQEALAKIIGHNASTLCSKEGSKKLNEYRVVGNTDFDSDPNSYSDEWDNWNFDDPNSTPTQQTKSAMPSMHYNENNVRNSNMPDAIKESMMNKQIDIPQYEATSFLDSLPKKKPRVIKESVQQPSTQQSVTPNIDYNYLKYIIKECLNEYFAEKGNLNENVNTLKQIGLSEGKIKLVDNKGNIFSAILEHTGNIKDRKKS